MSRLCFVLLLATLASPTLAQPPAEPSSAEPTVEASSVEPVDRVEPVDSPVAVAPVDSPAAADPSPSTPLEATALETPTLETPTLETTEAPLPIEPAPRTPPGTLRLGDVLLRPLVQARFRYEDRTGTYGNGVEVDDQRFVTTRIRLGLAAEWSLVRAVVQIQDARSFGSFPGVDDPSSFGLHQGFLELGNEDVSVRVGRQEIDWGGQRMLGALDWTMNARSFDAVRVLGRAGGLELEAFGAMLRPKRAFASTQGEDTTMVAAEGDYLAGARLAWAPIEGLRLEPYVLYRHDGPIDEAPARSRDIVSPGLLGTLRVGAFFASAEAVLQTGDANGSRHFAYALAGDAGANVGSTVGTTISGGGSIGSGTSNDGAVDELENFFPTNHKFYGYADLFGLRNVVEGHVDARLRPGDLPFDVQLAAFWFGLQQANARWSNAGGATLGQSDAPGSRSLGGELDVVVAYRPWPGVGLAAGYSVFVPAAGAKRLGHDDPTHWAFLMLTAQTP